MTWQRYNKNLKNQRFWRNFFVLDKFDRILSSVIDSHLGLRSKLTGWTTVEIGFQQYDVQSFPFESFEDVKHCRLVVQRQRSTNSTSIQQNLTTLFGNTDRLTSFADALV